MVAHEAEADANRNQPSSMWLSKTQSKTRIMSVWVWIVGIMVFCAIGAAIGFVVYFSHQRPAHSDPGVLGGKEQYSMVNGPSSILHNSPGQTPVPTKKAGGGPTLGDRAEMFATAAPGKRHYKLHLRRVFG